MPRLTEKRREAKRAEIVAAARRCFAREGFHQTSMPDIASEAGVSTGAPYRYFASKEEIILEIAGEAFRVIFAPVDRLLEASGGVSMGDLVAASVEPVSGLVTFDAAGDEISVDELLRCAVQAWGELLTHEGMRERAVRGFDLVSTRVAEELRRGQEAGVVSPDLDPLRGTRVVMALLHGFVLQRVAFGLHDATGFADDVRIALQDTGVLVARH